MGLRAIATADCKAILQDAAMGFGWPITITDPAGSQATLTGFSNDIAEIIDPETGVAVSGRLATVALHLESLSDNGFAIPEGETDETKKPWIVEFQDTRGNDWTFKVQQSNPDRGLGLVTLILESYEK